MRVLASVVLIALVGGPAIADRAEAERFFRNGADAYKTGKFEVAALNFDQAYAQLAVPEVAYSAAQAHRLQYQVDLDPEQLRKAIELYEAYLAKAPTGTKVKEANAQLARLRAVKVKVMASGATMAPPPAPEQPQLYVSVMNEHAMITVDGSPVERYTPVDVSTGSHEVTVSADGYVSETRTVPVGAGRAMIAIDLTPKPALLKIHSQPDAHVAIDGRVAIFRGATTEVAPGRRLITVTARGRIPLSRDIELAPGQELTLAAPLAPTAQRRAVRWVWIGSAALATGALVMGGIALHADFKASDLRDGPPLDDDGERAYLRQRTIRDRDRALSLVLGGVALAGVGAGLAMYYLDHQAAESQLRPMEQQSKGGFTPMAFGGSVGDAFGLGYHGGF